MTGRPRRSWDYLLWVGLAVWAVGFVWHWWRPSLWVLDVFAVPLMAALYGIGFLLVAVAVLGMRRWAMALTLLPLLALSIVVVNPSYRVAPQAYFTVHRPLFDVALGTDPGTDYYGADLPVPLRFLTADGKVSDVDGFRFFPQWIGIPDDAGGYLYHPHASPAGVDLYGRLCDEPVELGDGWWMC